LTYRKSTHHDSVILACILLKSLLDGSHGIPWAVTTAEKKGKFDVDKKDK
jgi:hypothetical protein